MKKKLIVIFVIGILIIISSLYSIYTFVYLPKNQKAGKCLIVTDKNCRLLKTEEGRATILQISANLPNKTKLFSPIEGDCITGFTSFDNGSKINGIMVKKFDVVNNKEISYIFSLGPNYKCPANWVKKGDYIGETSGDTSKDFKLLINIRKNEENASYSDSEKNILITEINSLIKKIANKNEN